MIEEQKDETREETFARMNLDGYKLKFKTKEIKNRKRYYCKLMVLAALNAANVYLNYGGLSNVIGIITAVYPLIILITSFHNIRK